MAIVIMRAFLREELEKGAGDAVLKYVKILWNKACEADALKVWRDHDADGGSEAGPFPE